MRSAETWCAGALASPCAGLRVLCDPPEVGWGGAWALPDHAQKRPLLECALKTQGDIAPPNTHSCVPEDKDCEAWIWGSGARGPPPFPFAALGVLRDPPEAGRRRACLVSNVLSESAAQRLLSEGTLRSPKAMAMQGRGMMDGGGFDEPREGSMRRVAEPVAKVALLGFILLVLWWALEAPLSSAMNLGVMVGGLLLVFPLVLVGRWLLDRKRTPSRIVCVTTFVHVGMLLLLGITILRAVVTHREWSGPVLPIPSGIGLALVWISGVIGLFTVFNLALKGWGAPFYIALSRKVAVDWMYGWTRNPMVLSTIALLVSVGIWYQSVLFVLWVLALWTPALLFFVKVYEERELEIRFGKSYLKYKSRTPFLFPRRPRGG